MIVKDGTVYRILGFVRNELKFGNNATGFNTFILSKVATVKTVKNNMKTKGLIRKSGYLHGKPVRVQSWKGMRQGIEINQCDYRCAGDSYTISGPEASTPFENEIAFFEDAPGNKFSPEWLKTLEGCTWKVA